MSNLAPQQVRLWFRVALVFIGLFPLLMAAMQMSGALEAGLAVVNGGLHWQAALFALWEPFVCLGISLKLLAVFHDRFNETNHQTQWLSASAYTVYIMHPFFVILATWLLTRLALPAIPTALLVALLSVPTCFLVSNLLRKIPLLSRIV